MFRYLGFTSFCDVLFAIFTVSWVITRQIMFSLVFVSTWKSVKKLPFKWDPEAGHYLNMYIYIGFLVLLGTLVVRFEVIFFARVLTGRKDHVGDMVGDAVCSRVPGAQGRATRRLTIRRRVVRPTFIVRDTPTDGASSIARRRSTRRRFQTSILSTRSSNRSHMSTARPSLTRMETATATATASTEGGVISGWFLVWSRV